ncbi:grasp-with-spasm system ATP-grasp peptide maturase [Marinifilum caeruleilacunae]|uniref:Grasp-with-spasm system ATP-grasp peptide maturase n=1 Tax=Marinifilum caeruleilacunae TaxID=2499076 RepID=A0ABX1X1F9_9BACT|nr:grasp-with-spasm system ATP-grasp peptide maturase [Marinifilum caeruleilacunae]NOU62247.1 grasp-with-spasm system ATP-grasp peptide maturase [Marinifilum caeruleilacunae]
MSSSSNKNILVLGEEADYSTDLVMEWLLYANGPNLIRVNTEDEITINKIKLEAASSQVSIAVLPKHENINLDELDFYFYRRGSLRKKNPYHPLGFPLADHNIRTFINWEWKVCSEYIIDCLSHKNSWGNYRKRVVNKLASLQLAAKIGFKIPNTLVTEDVECLKSFIRTKACIIKPLSDIIPIHHDDHFLHMGTKEMSAPPLQSFYPSLLQTRIAKWIEIRVFVSYDKLYAMAIFSQNNTKTELDYRNYDRSKMNRMVPFELPGKIKAMVHAFMQEANVDTGSIDFILSPEREYVFLEINPVGNIEMLSENCNYYIEKHIAEQILDQINS